MSEPRTRAIAQLCGHLSDQRVGSFTFEENPARDDVHAVLTSCEHDVGSAHASQESELLGADHGDDNDVVFMACFPCQL